MYYSVFQSTETNKFILFKISYWRKEKYLFTSLEIIQIEFSQQKVEDTREVNWIPQVQLETFQTFFSFVPENFFPNLIVLL